MSLFRDLRADDNGAWATSSPHRKYVDEKEDDKVISAKVFSDSSDDDSASVVTIYRQYGIHKGTHEFRRIIATVRNSSGKQLPKAIVQYYFIGGANSECTQGECDCFAVRGQVAKGIGVL